MSTATADLNERYATRVLAAMMWSPGVDGDSFDRDVADDVADRHDVEVELNHQPARNADITVFARVDAEEFDGLSNTHSTGLFNFAVSQFHDMQVGDDGSVTVGFDGFRSPDDLEIEIGDRGLIVADDATKYAFVVTVE